MNQRTSQQNRAMHKFYSMLADALNAAGLDMKKTLKPEIDIPWTERAVKDHLWRPIQDAMFDKESTTELDTAQVSAVYEVLSRHLGERFGLHVPFPTREEE
jgi:hypothetical protein